MRHLSLVLGLGALVLVSGCADSKWSLFRSSSTNVRLPADRLLTAPELVNLQNNNARQIPAFVCTHLELDCKQGMVQEVHVPDGKLACQKPRYFRMQAEALARTQADVGSNDQEFWYWIAKGEPYLFYCSYQDLASGVRTPFPFQPEWVMEALGMSEYETNPTLPYEVQRTGRTIQLVQTTSNLQGQRIRKITEFNPSTLRVTAHTIQNDQGKEICKAQIIESQEIAPGVVLPRRISFAYPAEGLEMKMTLGHRTGDVILYPQQFSPQQVGELFTRRNLVGVQNFDLARGPEGTNQVAPAGGLQR